MRAVIYDAEYYEPITVIDIPQDFVREIESGKRDKMLRFPVIKPILSRGPSECIPCETPTKVVTLRFEPIWKNSERLMWLVTTQDAESALLLRAAFLPGQRGELNRRLEMAFLNGLMAAVR